MAGWNVYALGNLTVTNISSSSPNAFSGRLVINGAPPELNPAVVGFRPANNSPMLVALIYSGRDFSSFLPALKGTPADDLNLKNLVAVLAPPTLNLASPIQFPANINGIALPAIGGSSRPLNGATSIFADLSLANNSVRLIQSVGASNVNLQLAGAIDPRLLLGGIPGGSQTETEVINTLSLSIGLGKNLGLSGNKPVFLNFGDSSLLIKGVGGKIASGISTSLTVNVGNGLRFDAVSINQDPVKQTLSIQSGAITPTGNWLTLPVAGASINQLVFNASIDERIQANNSFRLDGKYTLTNAAPQNFSVALSGGSPAQYKVSVNNDMTLGQLLGWHPPGLDAIALRNVTAGNNYTSAEITLQGLNFTAIAFKGAGQKLMNAAFVYDAPLKLSTMVTALRGTPLDDLELTQPAFVLSPAENGTATVALPTPLATHLGVPSLSLNPGLNLSAQTKPLGELAVLLSKVNLANLSLPLKGNLDLSVLTSKPGDIVQTLINSLDLRIPLPSPKPSWKPDFLTLGDSTLMVKGVGGKIATGISTSLAVNVGNGLRFDAVSINHDPLKQTISLQSGSITPTGNWLTLPVNNATIKQLAFNALIDENNRANTSFKLNGKYTLAFQLDSSGGVSIDLQGKTLSPWDNALGIRGLTMDTGTRIELKVSVTSEVTLTFVGKSHIGKREVDLTGSASVLLADGMIDKGAFEGKLSELDIEDLMALTNGVVAATGGQPIQHNLPVLKLTKIDVAFASPGVSVPEMKLDGGGMRVAGDLWFMLKNQALGRANVSISENGMLIDGKLADFSTGPIAFKNNVLDAKATLTPPAPPYFKIHGGVSLFGKTQDAGLTLSGINMEVQTNLDLGDLLKFDFKANSGIPPGGLSSQELSKYDLSLNARLKSDIPAWLRKDGKKPVETMVNGVKQGMVKLINDLNAAQSAVDGLNTKINTAKTEARKTAKSAQSMLTDAQNKVDSLEKQITKMKSRISDAKDNIHKCDYTKSTRLFGKKISAPDIPRNIRCAADNIDYGAKVVSLEAQRDSLIVSKTAADKTLSIIKSGIGDTDVADLDPKVIELEGELTIATGVLEAAKSLAQGIEKGDQLLDNALNKFAQGNVFVLKDSLIEGSVQKAIAGQPVVMGLSFDAAGQDSHLDFALSFTNPTFTASQLEALALYVFSQVLQTAANDGATLPPGLQQLVHQAYIAKSDAVATELAKAMKENGL